MSYIEVSYPKDKKAFYALLKEQLRLYTGGETNQAAVLANASAVLAQAFPNANWVGFYLVEGEELVVGPFQGKPAVSRIAFGKGVCGTAWKERKSQVVAEVACFAGHIACDCNTHSEIVVPLWRSGEIWGVLDMDSVLPGHFTEEDREGLEAAVPLLDRGAPLHMRARVTKNPDGKFVETDRLVTWESEETGPDGTPAAVRTPAPAETVLPASDFTAAGKHYSGIRELKVREPDHDKGICRDKYGRYVLEVWERFPCFDSFDFLHENRFYRWFYIMEGETLTCVYYADGRDKVTVTEDVGVIRELAWKRMQDAGVLREEILRLA